MGSGSYVIAEWESVTQKYSDMQRQYQETLAKLDQLMMKECSEKWHLGFDLAKPFGGAGTWGRTTILPALCRGNFGGLTVGSVLTNWRQRFTTTGNQLVLTGATAGTYQLQEDIKIAWIGLAFPNKEQLITELKWQIGDTKFGRLNLEEMLSYNKPAVVFEDGYFIDEEQAFEITGFVEGPLATDLSGLVQGYQRVVMLGYAAYKQIDKVLGNPGAAIT